MTKDYRYSDSTFQRTGVMVCAGCRLPIGAEPYRYYETAKGFVNHHRACSSTDAGWLKVDAELARADQRRIDVSRDAQAFFAKWGVTDLSDWLEISERSK